MSWPWSTKDDQSREKSSSQPGSPLNPDTLLTSALLTAIALTSYTVYKRHLRRIPNAEILRLPSDTPGQTTNSSKSFFGTITSVNDGDNVRLYHTPLLSALRRIPKTPKTLKDQTIHVRIAGIDAPELAHFGRPAQPYSTEALEYLRSLARGRKARVWLHRRDQYGRIVGSVYIRRAGMPGLPRFLMTDVGFEMLKAGWATVYEAKFGAEFGGREAQYRKAEALAKRRGLGMWKGHGKGSAGEAGFIRRIAQAMGFAKKEQKLETPREFKDRMKRAENHDSSNGR